MVPSSGIKFERRPVASVIGVCRSYRSPRFRVSHGLTRQSSWTNMPYCQPVRTEGADPTCRAVESVMPYKKSAKEYIPGDADGFDVHAALLPHCVFRPRKRKSPRTFRISFST